jgi:hypothetical protein
MLPFNCLHRIKWFGEEEIAGPCLFVLSVLNKLSSWPICFFHKERLRPVSECFFPKGLFLHLKIHFQDSI